MQRFDARVVRSMTAAAANSGTPVPPRRARATLRDGVLLALITLLVAAAMTAARNAPWTPGSDLGYGLGVAAGVALLSLFLYPLRKRWSVAQRWGGSRGWFAAHMALGIAAPLLASLHSTLAFGSLNATIAFACMALVAASGVVGRFLYARIHAGLYGVATDVQALAEEVARQVGALRAGGELDPELDACLAAFVSRADRAGMGGLRHPLRFLLLGADRLLTTRRARRRIATALRAEAFARGWDDATLSRRIGRKRALVATYLRGVQRVAQFRVFQRLFSWWHVLHVPLVWMLVATVIAHVVAVHMY
jgi:hypothetical protein